MDEDEEDQVLEIWNDEYYGSDKDYMYWNEDFGEYDKNENIESEFDEANFDSLDNEIEFFDNEGEDDEDLSEFLDDFFDDEDE